LHKSTKYLTVDNVTGKPADPKFDVKPWWIEPEKRSLIDPYSFLSAIKMSIDNYKMFRITDKRQYADYILKAFIISTDDKSDFFDVKISLLVYYELINKHNARI